MNAIEQLSTTAGRVTGSILAPVFLVTSYLRRARTFHPDGVVYRGEVTPVTTERRHRRLADRLAGPALVRLSGGLRRGQKSSGEVLGLAIRLHRKNSLGLVAEPSDQDLLFVTIPSLWMGALAFLTTDANDYLGNSYFTLGKFEDEGLGVIKLRARPTAASASRSRTREDRLRDAVEANQARFVIEARKGGSRETWEPVAVLTLEKEVSIGPEQLRMTPFHAGRGLAPIGFLQAVREAPYLLSQKGRMLGDEERARAKAKLRVAPAPKKRARERAAPYAGFPRDVTQESA